MSRRTPLAAALKLLSWVTTILVAGWLGYLICAAAPQASEHVFSAAIRLQLIAFVPALLYGGFLVLRRRLPGGSPLDWPLVLLLGAYLAGAAASVDRRVSLESALLVLLAILIFYVLSDLDFLDTLVLQRGLMAAGAGAALWALWNVAGDYSHWLNFANSARGGFHLSDLIPPTVPKVHGVGDHPNILGMALTLVMPFYVLAVYRSPTLWERLVWAIALLATLLAVFLTLSRGAWIGAAVGGLVTVGGLAFTIRFRPQQATRPAIISRLRRRPSTALLVGAAVAVVLLIIAVVAATQWSSRPQWLFRESLSPRQDVFNAGLHMFRDHPLLGAGPGTYGLLYPQYSGEYPIHAIHAHNGFLQVAVDAGVAGLAALALLIGVLAWLIWRSYWNGSESQRLLAIACAGALVGFAIHNLADAANIWKTAMAALAAVSAIVVSNHRALRREAAEPHTSLPARATPLLRRLLRLLPRALVAVAIVGLFIAWGRIDVPHYHYSSSLANLVDGRTLAAVQEGQKAVDEDPDLAIYQLQLGMTQTLAFTQGESSVLLDHGIEHLQRAVELDPRGAIGYANLARALVLAGRNEEARTAALATQRLAGADATVLLAAGSVLEDVGASQDAIQTYALAVTRMGSLADSDFWGTTTFRREHYAEIIGSSVLSLNACSTGYLVSQISGDSPKPTTLGLPALKDGCRALVFASPDDLYARVNLAEILMASGGHDDAYEQLTFAINREPDFGPARTSMGKWYAAAGDVTRAREEWILGGQLGEAESLLLLGDTYPPDQVPADVVKRLQDLAPIAGGAVTDYPIGWVYYQMKFARQSPPTYLLPDDWQTALPRLWDRIQQALQRWRVAR